MNSQPTLTPDAYLCEWPNGSKITALSPVDGTVGTMLYALTDEEWGVIAGMRRAKNDEQNKAEIARMAIRAASEYTAWCQDNYARPSLDSFYNPNHFNFRSYLVGQNTAIGFAKFYERVMKIISASAGG